MEHTPNNSEWQPVPISTPKPFDELPPEPPKSDAELGETNDGMTERATKNDYGGKDDDGREYDRDKEW